MSKVNHEHVIQLLQDKGWSREQAIGITANLKHESDFNPAAVGDGGKAYGLAQWHPDRQAEFRTQYGKDIKGSSLEEQVSFVDHELRAGREQAAGKALSGAKTAADATSIVTRLYERPLNAAKDAASRTKTALGWLGITGDAGEDVPAVAPARAVAARTEGWPTLPTAREPNAPKAPSPFTEQAGQDLIKSLDQTAAATQDTSQTRATTAAVDTARVQQVQARENTGISDVFSASRNDPRDMPTLTVLGGLLGPSEGVIPAGWTYMGNKDQIEAGADDTERDYLRENVRGPSSLALAQAEIGRRRELDKTYRNASGFENFLGHAGGGITDPVGLAAAVLTTKGLGYLGYGASALAAAGRPVAATASFLAEGAIGNMAVEGIQDAMGEVKTSEDYVMAATTGALMQAPFVKGTYHAAVHADAELRLQGMKDQARTTQQEAVTKAAQETGETNPVKLAEEVERRQTEQIESAIGDATNRQTREQVVPKEVAREMRAEWEAGTDALADPKKLEATEHQQITDDIAKADEVLKAVPPEQEVTLPDDLDEALSQGKLTPAQQALVTKELAEQELHAVDREARTNPEVRQTVPERTPQETVAGAAENALGSGSRTLPGKDGRDVRLRWRLQEAASTRGTASVAEVLDALLTQRGTSAYVKAAAEHLRSAVSKEVDAVRVRFTSLEGRAQFNFQIPEVQVTSALGGKAGRKSLADVSAWHQESVVHEMYHAATHSKIEAYLRGNQPTSAVHVAELDALRTQVQAEVNARYGQKEKLTPKSEPNDYSSYEEYLLRYGADNLHEFATMAMTSQPFQRLLASMPGASVAGKAGSAWESFLAKLVDILGIAKDKTASALKDATRLVDQIMRADGSDIKYLDGAQALFAPKEAAVPAASTARVSRSWGRKMFDHAQDYMARNPIDPAKLNTLTKRLGAESDGVVLASSPNPVMQLVASLVTEVTTGAAGRKATAAIRTEMLHRKLLANTLPEYENSFKAWGKDNGATLADDLMRGEKRRVFDKEVYSEILNRRVALYQSKAHLAVQEAADSLQGLFERSRIEQVSAGTLGSDNLPGGSAGYVPQALDGAKLQALPVKDLELVHQNLSQQFQNTLGWDSKFSNMFAEYYTERVRKRAMGSKEIDGMAAGGDASQVVRDTLEEMRRDPNLRDRAAAAMKTGAGSGQTKKRLDLDLRQDIRPGLKLMDVYVTDPLSLARQYSRRTAGTVALTESGIHGIRGVRELRHVAEGKYTDGTQASLRELQAYDRVMSEMLGTPVAGEVVSAGATNLGLLVSLQRLGGLVFTQAAETYNVVNHLGFRSLLGSIASFPGMIKEVGALKRGETVTNNILRTVEVPGGEFGTDVYRLIAPLDAPDARLHQYTEQSGLLTRLMRAGGHLQTKVSGFRALMAAQHRAVAEQIVLKATRYIRDGKDSVALADMGFTPEVATAVKADLANIARWDANDKLVDLDLTKVSDPRTAEAFMQAVHRGTSQIIQGTFIGERNRWFHNDYLRLLLQLRTFGLIASEKQWGRQAAIHGGGAKGYAVAGAMLLGNMAMALPIHLARIELASAGRSDREDYIKQQLAPGSIVRALLNYSSLSGSSGDALELMSGLAGWADKDTQEILGARQQAAGVGRIIPAAGSVDQAFKVLSGKSDVHNAIKQLPFSNLWYLAPVMNLTKD